MKFQTMQTIVNGTLTLIYTSLVLGFRMKYFRNDFNLSPIAQLVVFIVTVTPVVFLIYYIQQIAFIAAEKQPPMTILFLSNNVYSLFDSLHNSVFMLFGFLMMNVEIHFDQSIKSPIAIVKRMERVMCITRTYLISQLMINVVIISVGVYVGLGFIEQPISFQQTYDTYNTVIQWIIVCFLIPLNIFVYLAFLRMLTRLRKVLPMLQKKAVTRMLYCSLSVILGSFVLTAIGSITQMVNANYQSLFIDKVLTFFYLPVIKSLNIIQDCMQALIVLFVIKRLFELKTGIESTSMEAMETQEEEIIQTQRHISDESGDDKFFNKSLLRTSVNLSEFQEEMSTGVNRGTEVKDRNRKKIVQDNFDSRASSPEFTAIKISSYDFFEYK